MIYWISKILFQQSSVFVFRILVPHLNAFLVPMGTQSKDLLNQKPHINNICSTHVFLLFLITQANAKILRYILLVKIWKNVEMSRFQVYHPALTEPKLVKEYCSWHSNHNKPFSNLSTENSVKTVSPPGTRVSLREVKHYTTNLLLFSARTTETSGRRTVRTCD